MNAARACLFLSPPSSHVLPKRLGSGASPFLVSRRYRAQGLARRVRIRTYVVAIAANGDGAEEGGGGEEGGEETRQTPEEVRANRVNNLRQRLDETKVPGEGASVDTSKAERYLERETQLIWLTSSFARELFEDCNRYFDKPHRQLVAASLAILFGFFAATSATTIIGSVADWDPLAAAVLLVWTEAFTRYYYYRAEKSLLLRLFNAFKIGLIYGCAVDACKVRVQVSGLRVQPR